MRNRPGKLLTIPKYASRQTLHLVTVESASHCSFGGGRGGGSYENLLGRVARAPHHTTGGGGGGGGEERETA